MTAPLNASLATIRTAGREYPRKMAQNCRVCKSANRLTIEQMVVEGLPPSAIAKRIPADDHVTPRNVSDHFRNSHLPVADEGVVRFKELISERDGACRRPGR